MSLSINNSVLFKDVISEYEAVVDTVDYALEKRIPLKIAPAKEEANEILRKAKTNHITAEAAKEALAKIHLDIDKHIGYIQAKKACERCIYLATVETEKDLDFSQIIVDAFNMQKDAEDRIFNVAENKHQVAVMSQYVIVMMGRCISHVLKKAVIRDFQEIVMIAQKKLPNLTETHPTGEMGQRLLEERFNEAADRLLSQYKKEVEPPTVEVKNRIPQEADREWTKEEEEEVRQMFLEIKEQMAALSKPGKMTPQRRAELIAKFSSELKDEMEKIFHDLGLNAD